MMKWVNMIRWILALIFGVAAVLLSFYGDTVGRNMMAVAGIALFLDSFFRIVKNKDELKMDEMTKTISSIASEFALFAAIWTIGILTIIIHFYPSLFGVYDVLAILIAVIILSKITYYLYYTKVKKEIGFC
ncbi:MAG: hypothetical protein OIN66_16845 [Candidatus Methanoperedens sp.]|nr:hypothetical protein [Candidatus Methanoperedens sp.]